MSIVEVTSQKDETGQNFYGSYKSAATDITPLIHTRKITHIKEYMTVLGFSTMGLLVSIFIIFNIISTVIILAACVISGRASRVIDPHVEAQMIAQRELAIAVSKLRVVTSQPTTVNAAGRHLVFPLTDRRTAIEEAVAARPSGEQVIAASQA